MRRQSWFLLTLAAITGTICPPHADADSLWKKRDARVNFLVQDSKARNVGDLLTIVINEQSAVDNSEDKDMKKQSTIAANGSASGSSSGGLENSPSSATGDMKATSSRTFAGSASYKDSREYTDNITVTVVDVLPNGNMVVSGRRNIMIAGEARTLAVSGVVRSIDIGPDNKINSKYVADLRTVYEGDGPSRRFVRQGWFSKAANKLWPF